MSTSTKKWFPKWKARTVSISAMSLWWLRHIHVILLKKFGSAVCPVNNLVCSEIYRHIFLENMIIMSHENNESVNEIFICIISMRP